MLIGCYLAILALQIPLANYGSEPPENICNNVDPSTRSEKLEADISGFDTITSSSGILKKEFQESERRMRDLAKSILTSQLEPGKPEYLDRDNQRCITREEILAKRMPYIAKEINRLLQPDNARYFELVSIGDISPVMFSFNEWGSSLKDPKDRIQFWNRVLSLLPETSKDLRREPLRQLVYAHASYGGQLMLSDRQAAKSEINLAESLSKNVVMDSEFPGILENLKHWIERKPEPPTLDVTRLLGEYRTGPGFDVYTLILKEGNIFEFEGQSDAMDLCTFGRWKKKGEFRIEGDYLVLIPGPGISDYGIESPEVLVPVFWGNHSFFFSDSYDGPVEFCNFVNSGKVGRADLLGWYHRQKGEQSLQQILDANDEDENKLVGIPEVPKEWNVCLLKEPLHAEVIQIEEGGIILNMGKDSGLQPGMKLYSEDSLKVSTWKISEVGAKQSHAVPFGEVPTITIGEKLSTPIPE